MTAQREIKDHLIIALDTSSENEALTLVEKLKDYAGYFKVGHELFTSVGPKIFKAIKDQDSKVFYDGKLLDIPNTVSRTVTNLVHHRVDMLNVYMTGGTRMLQEAKNALLVTAQIANLQPPKLLGITVLTSITDSVLQNDLKVQTQIDEYVLHLAQLAFNIHLDGIICSPNEAKLIRESTDKNFLIVTPGIRPKWAKTNDQERVSTPKEAILNGASHIVVGRPITEAKDPQDAAKKILDEIKEALY